MSRARIAPAARTLALLLAVGFGLPAAAAVDEVQALLKRIHDAAARHSYSGTYVVSAGGQVSSLRVTHVGQGQDQVERIEALDGQLRQVYRHNDRIHLLWPKAHAAQVEQRSLGGRLPGQLQTGVAPLEMYDAVRNGHDRVAGQEAEVVLLKPRDTLRYAHKLWLDQQTGLLLRTDILDEQGKPLESAGFSELRWLRDTPAQPLLAEMNSLKGYKVERAQLTPTTLEQEGWSLAKPPAGFLSSQVLRHPPGLGAPAASAATSTGNPRATSPAVVQAVYSDGLSTISLFIEPFDGQRHAAPDKNQAAGAVTQGATQLVGLRQGEWWITAVGDVPRATLQAFASRLERRR